ncbi:hypothetical protein ABR738_07600 [Streptomyces sp. Edi4]|uniref:hypothetical protein n=1 Tax=Streptomyces sp. Edi4 TaxID=3162527 RepID=UPI00330588A6
MDATDVLDELSVALSPGGLRVPDPSRRHCVGAQVLRGVSDWTAGGLDFTDG